MLLVENSDGKTETNVTPSISGNTFVYKTDKVPDGSKVVLSYSATVTEEAYKALEVKKGAKVGLNNDPTFSVNTLTNPVSPEPPAPAGGAAKTGD